MTLLSERLRAMGLDYAGQAEEMESQLATVVRERDELTNLAQENNNRIATAESDIEQLRAKLEDEKDIAREAVAMASEADDRVAASYRTGWAEGAKAARDADWDFLRRGTLVAGPLPTSATEAAALVVRVALKGLRALPLPVCPEGPPAVTGAADPTDAGSTAPTMSPCYYGGRWCEHRRRHDLGQGAVMCLDCGMQEGGAGTGGVTSGEAAKGNGLSGFVKASVAEERQAVAIKAAVASERARCLAALDALRDGKSSTAAREALTQAKRIVSGRDPSDRSQEDNEP